MIMIKGKIHQEDITVITIYAPNMGTSKYIKQLTDLKEGIGVDAQVSRSVDGAAAH